MNFFHKKILDEIKSSFKEHQAELFEDYFLNQALEDMMPRNENDFNLLYRLFQPSCGGSRAFSTTSLGVSGTTQKSRSTLDELLPYLVFREANQVIC